MAAEKTLETVPVAKVYSFDVFDTCVTRTFALPRDLFFELGMRWAPAGWPYSSKHRFARVFQKRRIQAERRANRLTGPNRSADIYSIYSLFAPPPGLETSIEQLVQAEVALERESIYPVEPMISLINRLRQEGRRIVFLSDMYLPGRLLGPILANLGIMREGDVLYVSCDAGGTKHTGGLYRHVLEKEGVQAGEFSHVGDNAWADIRMAANAGIQTSHFTDTHLTSHERSIAGRGLPGSNSGSLLAGLSRRFRLRSSRDTSPDQHPADAVIYGTIVPFLLAYVAWVLEQAERAGVRRLYFVARDGQVLYRIAQELLRGRDFIDLRYLYGSRQAWLSPSISPNTMDWSRLLIAAGHSNSRHDILARAGLDDDAQAEFRALFNCSPEVWSKALPYQEAKDFLEKLLGDQVAMRGIYAAAACNRAVALAYFQQEGLLDSVPWALVDTGWALNSQAALLRILQASGHTHRTPQGFYIALEKTHLTAEATGPATSFIPRARSIFPRRRFVIEHAFTPSTHATTRGYVAGTDGIVPALGTELRNSDELDYAARLHRAATGAAQVVAGNERIASALKAHTGGIIDNAEEFLRRPRFEDVNAISSFGTNADLRHEKTFVAPLCRRLRVTDIGQLLLMNFSQRRREDRAHLVWLEGSIAISPWIVRVPLTAMLGVKSLLTRVLRRT